MTSKFLTLSAAVLAVSTLAACHGATGPLNAAPGKYAHEHRVTRADGTNVETKTTTDVGYDRYGNKTAVVKTEKTTDPEGLFNKKTNKSTEVYKAR